MADIPRLNGAIKALESGKPAFVPFSPGEISSALTVRRLSAVASRWRRKSATIRTTTPTGPSDS